MIDNLSLVCDKISQLIEYENHIIFLLQGEVGAGKTTLIKEFVKSINLTYDVTSPTYSIMHQYGHIYHYDLYMKSLDSLFALGLLDLLHNPGIHFVEWGDDRLYEILISFELKVFCITINQNNAKRIYEVK